MALGLDPTPLPIFPMTQLSSILLWLPLGEFESYTLLFVSGVNYKPKLPVLFMELSLWHVSDACFGPVASAGLQRAAVMPGLKAEDSDLELDSPGLGDA